MSLTQEGRTKAHEVEFISLEGLQLRLSVDGREYTFDLKTASPRLAAATQQQRDLFEIFASGMGIHWPAVDEDLSIDGLIRDATVPS